MGVVYEAEQISLGRRVALKVLPFAGALDAKQLQRFKNEAQAAAGLHHTNIVPVHFVGCERGVHFYAMQYIDGRTLAAVITELRRLGGRDEDGPETNPELSAAAEALICGQASPEAPTGNDPCLTIASPPPAPVGTAAAETAVQAVTSTGRSVRDPAYFGAVARLGQQAAEALEHAHEMGVVHRDIKPGNLLLDGQGNLWITDFGLAHCQSQAGLTMTGDLVGTLRYMSPEQALAKRVIVDHRTDIYSLGATLYELLTLQPVFAAKDRQELLRQIAFEEPRPPRKLNKAIPGELETIVVKALEKNPAERYGTAQEVAEDLGRFLKDEPIRARPPTLLQRCRRWMRRHKPLVGGAAAALLSALLVLAVGLGWVVRDQAAREEADRRFREEKEELAREALKGVAFLVELEKWEEAEGAVLRAEGVLAGVRANAGLLDQVQVLKKDVRLAEQLAQIPMRNLDFSKQNANVLLDVNGNFAYAFDRCGRNLLGGDPQESGMWIRARLIRWQLVAALDCWADIRRQMDGKQKDNGWKHLTEVVRVADPDRWRNRLRQRGERFLGAKRRGL
jgi:serine/threonine protein kinase